MIHYTPKGLYLMQKSDNIADISTAFAVDR